MRNRIIGSSELNGQHLQLHSSETLSQLPRTTGCEHEVCLFGPERYEPRYDYPLIVWLHSCRSSERELEHIMPALSLQNYVACAPRGNVSCDDQRGLYRWGQSPASAAIAEEVVFESMETACAQFSVARHRIFLAGFGSGATTAWRLALRYPQRFAGVVAMCGDFPHENQPLTNLDAARSMPTLWIFGNESPSCGVRQVCDTLPVLHAASLTVDIRQYSCGHELLSNMLQDVNSWLMERVTNQPASCEAVREESFSRN